MKKYILILALILGAVSLRGQVRGFGAINFVPPGGSLVSQHIHPRIWGLSPTTKTTIATKINSYYDDNPISPISDLPGSFGDVVDEMDSVYGTTANFTNALQYASTFCLIGHLLPSLTTGGATGINPDHTASEYGIEGARLAVAINSTNMTFQDGSFPSRLAVSAYDWCYDWLSAPDRLTVGVGLMEFEANCDNLYSSPYSADSHKSCSAMFDAAVAVAGDTGTPGTWGTSKLTEYQSVWYDGDTGVLGSESKLGNLYKSLYGYGSCVSNGMAYTNYTWQYDILGTESYRFAATTQTRAAFYSDANYSFLISGIYCLNNEIRPYARTNASGIYPNNLDWRMVRWQFGTTDQTSLGIWGYVAFSVAGSILNDFDSTAGQLGTWLQRNRVPFDSPSSFRVPYQWLTRFTMEDPTIASTNPDTLNVPLSTRFGDGRYLFRSAWDADASFAGNSVVQFYLSNFSAPGNGRETGSWSGHLDIYRKGPGIMSRGGSGHLAYCTGCLNTLIFQDANRTMPWADIGEWQADMAIRLLSSYNQPQATMRGASIVVDGSTDYLPTGYVRNRFAVSGTNPTDYIWADRTRWYTKTGWYTSAQAPATQTAVKTEIINFRPSTPTGPARVLRREYVVNTSNRWIPTMGWNPSADSITFNGTTTAGGFNAFTTFGQLKSTNTSILTASSAYNLSGYTTSTKNTLTIVLPSSASVATIGGADENSNQCTFVDSFGGLDGVTTPNNNTSLEGADVFGFRWTHEGSSQCADPESRSVLGIYGAFIRPTSIPNGTAINFLLCYELDDNGSTPGTCITLTALTNFIGVQWRDTDQNMIGIMSTDGLDVTTGAFTIPTAGTYNLLISDLGGSSRVFSSSGCFTATDSSGDTDLTFAVTPSHTIVMTAVTSGSNCAVSVN